MYTIASCGEAICAWKLTVDPISCPLLTNYNRALHTCRAFSLWNNVVVIASDNVIISLNEITFRQWRRDCRVANRSSQ